MVPSSPNIPCSCNGLSSFLPFWQEIVLIMRFKEDFKKGFKEDYSLELLDIPPLQRAVDAVDDIAHELLGEFKC